MLTIYRHNDIVVCMIPAFDTDGNLRSELVPSGRMNARRRFGITLHRQRLLGGLESALVVLQAAGCRRVYVDAVPNDYDAAWEPAGVNVAKLLLLEPVFGDFNNQRAAQKAKFFGEFFPSSFAADLVGTTFFDFFQIDKQTGNAKGIVALDL